MKIHTYIHQACLLFSVGESDECEIPVRIEYRYSPGAPAQGPSYASGGQPAEPPEVEIHDITLCPERGWRGVRPLQITLFELIERDEGLLLELIRAGEEKDQDDRDAAAEARWEMRKENQ